MKNSKIFLVEEKGMLTPMAETAYLKEDDLQALLEDYPDLLPGDQMNVDDPRRWLLVSRELGVPGGDNEAGRWSLDHLFLDQEGVPTFVECKRSSDTRSRREVVAQMLDYAANGISYWKLENLRSAAEKMAQKRGKELDEEIRNLVGSEGISKIDEYWKHVEQNLRLGIVRLIFVADSIPSELRRLVEFLNEQMTNTEVLAVEVKQFLGDNRQKVIVPRLIGMTETAREVKRNSSIISREEFLDKCPVKIGDFYNDILDTATEHGHTIYWGTTGFSIRIYLPDEKSYASIAYGYPPNKFQIYYAHLPWSDAQLNELRKEIGACGIFKESPKTSTAILEEGDFHKAKEAYLLMMRRVEESIGNS